MTHTELKEYTENLKINFIEPTNYLEYDDIENPIRSYAQQTIKVPL